MTPAELKEWRKRAGLSQRNVAEMLEIALPTWQRYERGFDWKTSAPVEVPRWLSLACAAMSAENAREQA